MEALPTAVKKFFDKYPDVKLAFETPNGSVYATEESANKSVWGHSNKTLRRHSRPEGDRKVKKG